MITKKQIKAIEDDAWNYYIDDIKRYIDKITLTFSDYLYGVTKKRILVKCLMEEQTFKRGVRYGIIFGEKTLKWKKK